MKVKEKVPKQAAFEHQEDKIPENKEIHNFNIHNKDIELVKRAYLD